MKSAVQRTTIFASLSWSVTAWELTWSQAEEIVYPRVCLTISSEGAAGVAKRMLFCLPKSSDAFLLDILVSLSRSLATELRRSRDVSQGRQGAEKGGVDVD